MIELAPDRYFDPDPTVRKLARTLYDGIAQLPIISPHGHVDPALLADESATLGTTGRSLYYSRSLCFPHALFARGFRWKQLG